MRKGEINLNQEFEKIISPYIKNKTYLKLKNYRHHNTTRLNHLYNVAVYSYWIGKKLNLFCDVDFKSLLAGALLHDFYFVKQKEENTSLYWFTHCELAEENAAKHFDISEKERNIILAHMFPLAKHLPHSKEAWIVSIADKWSALLERLFNKNYPIPA